jgi:glycosyltransferase involved in cell wall biosynthesis
MNADPRPPPLRVLFLIPSLDPGGAERQATALARELAGRGHEIHLVTFRPGGDLAHELTGSSVRLRSLHKRGPWDLYSLLTLRRTLAEVRPQIVYAWLSTANLAAGLMSWLCRGIRVVWSVRDAGLVDAEVDRLTRMVRAVEARASGTADLVVANSDASRLHCVRRGFPAEKVRVISNGIDVVRFAPDAAAGDRVRAEWGLDRSALVIGMVARIDPVKDHFTFLRAAAVAMSARADLRFVAVGGGEARLLDELKVLASSLGLDDRVIWAGPRHDVPACLNALDLATLTSHAESFPNAVAEAMATGRPCVVTDVGDCAKLVASSGIAVPRGNPSAVANAWLRLASERDAARRALGELARDRIIKHFSVHAAASATEEAFAELLSPAPAPRRR